MNKNFIAEPIVIACFNTLSGNITANNNSGRLGLSAGVLCGETSSTPSSDVVPHYHYYTPADATAGDVEWWKTNKNADTGIENFEDAHRQILFNV